MTDAELIRAAGPALFGVQWQSDLARALGVNRVTVQRWRKGQEAPRLGVWRDLLALIDARIAELTEVRQTLGAKENTDD
jgi:DNA-binding XRE family transcriptional regulator